MLRAEATGFAVLDSQYIDNAPRMILLENGTPENGLFDRLIPGILAPDIQGEGK